MSVTAALISLAGPIATVCAAAAAAFVAYRLGQNQIEVAKSQVDIARLQAAVAEKNWQTANEKIVLDLMDKRIAVYDEIRAVVREITRNHSAADAGYWKYLQTIDKVPYLFGNDVQTYLEELRLSIIDADLGATMMSNPTNPDYSDGVKLKHRKMKEILEFYRRAPPLFEPYIRAHQKVQYSSEPVIQSQETASDIGGGLENR